VPIAFPSEEAQSRGNHYLEVIARMKPGVTLKQAKAEMETIAARLAQQYPKENLRIGTVVNPLHEEVVGGIRPALLVLLGAVGFVLLIACANVTNLLLARAAVRQKEIALRLALGASRSRLTRQFLTESVLLAVLGAEVGLIFAFAGLRILKTFVRTRVEPMSLATALRNAVWAVDKDQPVSNIDTMEHIVAGAVARQRFSTMLLGIFATLALMLAVVGIYGVMSYSVAQRTHEIGIRMALGARRGDVLKMTVKQGLKLVVMGVVIGLVAAFVLTRVMASLLFGVSATDPVTFVSIPLVLMGVAMLASYIPALRATRVDPMVALRAQ
jgi:ABC-type antimicrobial peptide transport system permease subunit